MDHVERLRRETAALAAAARAAADSGEAPLVPSCPGWSMSDLVLHLGGVHRRLTVVFRERRTEPADHSDLSVLGLPADRRGWPAPETAPNRGPIPAGLIDWFADGAAALAELFRTTPADTPLWTWWHDRTAGFWTRMQAIEAAVHRWDAENAIGTARPVDAEPAADAIAHTFEVMAPARRAWKQAPPGSGECLRFRRTDGTGDWSVRFDGDEIGLTTGDAPGGGPGAGAAGVELAGTASDLMLFLWQRLPVDRLTVTGEARLAARYFELVPPV